MSLLQERTTFKPMKYPWAFEAYLKQQQSHWLPTEVPLSEDLSDWENKLDESERDLLTQIFRFFTQGDVDIAAGYIDKYMPTFKPPEVRMMMSSFAAMEAVHVHAYSLLIDTLGMPESEYTAFTQYKAMADKHDFYGNFNPTDKESIAKTLAVYSAFGEGLQLFSSFIILLNFQRFNKMKNMCQIVTWSIRDETLHVESMLKLFRTFVDENPQIVTDQFKKDIYDIARTMVELEDNFIDLAFAGGGVQGLTAGEVKQYIRYIADRRLVSLGLKPNWEVSNPLDWLDTVLYAVEHTNFFENRATEYSKGALTGDWSQVWGNKNEASETGSNG